MDEHVTLGPPFASGRTAEFYPWKGGWALKLFRPGWKLESAAYEAYKARAVHAAGLPVPAVEDVIQVNNRPGIIYERITGVPLNQLLPSKPWALFSLARLLADLHLAVHRQTIPDLPPLKERLAGHIQSVDGMPEDIKLALLDTLSTLPDGESVCHGDFHPLNIFITAQGPVILDWMDATRGSPLGDVARSSFLLKKASLPADIPARRLIEMIRTVFHNAYLKRYFSGQSIEQTQWESWQIVIAAARLAEDIPEEQDRLVGILKSWAENKKRAESR